MRILTFEDVRDIYLKMAQRGVPFSLSKFTLNKIKRTKSSFNSVHFDSSNWWIIPEVRQRWNELITDSKDTIYEEYVSQNYFQGYSSLKMLSIGSGVCSHELKLAELNPHWEIICVDFSEVLLTKAKETADEKQLTNIRFLNKNIHECEFMDNSFDVVFFHQSLHHFKDLDAFVKKHVVEKLKPVGYLMMNEYVGANRLQYSREQVEAINTCLSFVPKIYRQLYKTNLYKKWYYGSGLLRMIMADPSECVESEQILTVINKYFEPVFKRSFGGNLLMPVLKDISHHFVNARVDQEKQLILNKLFEFENKYLLAQPSDFVFGIFKKRAFPGI